MSAPIWQTSDFSPAPCLPCCSTPTPSDCSCALLIPPPIGAVPYSDYATALAVVNGSDPEKRAVCFGYLISGSPGATIDTFDVDVSVANEAAISAVTLSGLGQEFWLSVSLAAGATITIPYSITVMGGVGVSFSAEAFLYECDNPSSPISSDSSGSDTGTLTISATVAKEYFIRLDFAAGLGFPGTADLAVAATVTSSVDMVTNPVIALWDDSGTTRSLWACPKLLLPPLTESTGDWYASCADAATDITDFVNDCKLYAKSVNETQLQAYSISGSTVSLSDTAQRGGYGWIGINLEAGETVSVACAVTANGTIPARPASVSSALYDDAGVLLDDGLFIGTETGASDTFVFTATYTGRYSLYVFGAGTGDTTAFSFTAGITSTGTLSVNPIQARYDLGLTCAGTLDCGDSCP